MKDQGPTCRVGLDYRQTFKLIYKGSNYLFRGNQQRSSGYRAMTSNSRQGI